MRDYLDSILDWIGESSLTDDEFDAIQLEDIDDNIAVYESLFSLLQSRESVSNSLSRLQFYFKSGGVDVGDETDLGPSSNIFVGGPLDDDD